MKHSRLARLALLWLAACSGHDPRAGQPSTAPPTIASAGSEVHGPTSRPPLTAPHGGRIELVAVTDRGDAAMTSDSFGELRLWPTLDGTREPVVVRSPRAMQLALGRDGEGLFAAILDEAGGVELLRFDAAGGVLGRAQVSVQPAIAEVVAVPGGVLVRRVDHSVERFDVRGAATGRLVPASGQRVVSLAVRRDRALAGLTDAAADRASAARWIELGSSLTWGGLIELPEPLADLAISPGGHRVAGIGLDARSRQEVGKIVELAPRPAVVGTIALEPRRARTSKGGRSAPLDPPVIGFADDDNAVIGVVGQIAWASAYAATPWLPGVRSPYTPEGGIAVGDRVAAARGQALQLSTPLLDQFLGYRFVGDGLAATPGRFHDGGGVLLEASSARLWLDPALRAQPLTLDPELRDLALVLDDHHLLFMPTGYERPLNTRILVRDITSNTDTQIAVLEDVTVARYDPGTRVLAIAAGENIVRFRLAFAPIAATPLRTLARAGELRPFYLTDPALANGVVAVVDSTDESLRALVYRIDGADQGSPIAPQRLALAGSIAAVDRAGAVYVAANGLQVHRIGRPAESLALTGVTAISHDGAWFAEGYADEVKVSDAKGVVRWRRPVWKAGPVVWSLDDRTLFVAADGGAALSFDAATGEPLAIRCGWGFGLYERDVAAAANTPSACAAP